MGQAEVGSAPFVGDILEVMQFSGIYRGSKINGLVL